MCRAKNGGGLYLLAFGLLLGIALQVAAAWTLLVETGQHTPKDKGGGCGIRTHEDTHAP